MPNASLPVKTLDLVRTGAVVLVMLPPWKSVVGKQL